ncbi:hypothetical protein TNCV_2744081 [Trichonephila clavipes]|nr:hypothetical protein TNCV_2744081 [Trichonephila clavipes]
MQHLYYGTLTIARRLAEGYLLSRCQSQPPTTHPFGVVSCTTGLGSDGMETNGRSSLTVRVMDSCHQFELSTVEIRSRDEGNASSSLDYYSKITKSVAKSSFVAE